MKKRIISLLLVVSMVLSLLPVSALAAGTKDTTADSPFTDVKPGDWCYDAVLYAKANGFFSGTSETTFSPNGTMTRGMFVTVLGRMAGIDPAKYGGDTGFTDVPEGMYYAPYVKWAAQYGITGGTGDGRFSPDALITRQQMAALFVRYFENRHPPHRRYAIYHRARRFGRRGALCPGGRGEAVAGGSSERQRDAVQSHRATPAAHRRRHCVSGRTRLWRHGTPSRAWPPSGSAWTRRPRPPAAAAAAPAARPPAALTAGAAAPAAVPPGEAPAVGPAPQPIIR